MLQHGFSIRTLVARKVLELRETFIMAVPTLPPPSKNRLKIGWLISCTMPLCEQLSFISRRLKMLPRGSQSIECTWDVHWITRFTILELWVCQEAFASPEPNTQLVSMAATQECNKSDWKRIEDVWKCEHWNDVQTAARYTLSVFIQSSTNQHQDCLHLNEFGIRRMHVKTHFWAVACKLSMSQ